MIRTIEGKFHPQADGTCVIETAGGIGFLVTIAANSPLYKYPDGETVKVFTLMTVRQDDVSLFGFDSMEELELFRLLIRVSGVGAKAGMAIMSVLPIAELKRAIATGNAKMLTNANGVGKRTAERVVLELKDKVDAGPVPGDGRPDAAVPDTATGARREAVDALITLGYSRNEAEGAVGKVKRDDLTSEDYIRQALRNI